jgi:hypothetical protein
MGRRRWKSQDLVLQELENRTLLSVTTSLNSGVIDINLSSENACFDRALGLLDFRQRHRLFHPVVLKRYFAGGAGANSSSQDDPNVAVIATSLVNFTAATDVGGSMVTVPNTPLPTFARQHP